MKSRHNCMYVLDISGFQGFDISGIADSQQNKVLSGARLAAFEMVLHGVTSAKLEVKEMDVIQFRLKKLFSK